MNKVILLDKRPVGIPALSDFKFIEEEMPVASDGELLLKTLYVSVDPYLRGRMNDTKSYIPPFQLGQPIQSRIVAEILDSKNTAFRKGDVVSGHLQWKEYQLATEKGLTKVNPEIASLSSYLGLLGVTGLSAYLGLTEIGLPKAGETLVISGAAGAVGSVAGQIGKILGCRVVGLAGSDEKVDMLKSKLNFDEAINYKTTADLTAAIKAACPDGVDVYFDNVGGDVSDAVIANLNKFARIPLCGVISSYNNTKPDVGTRIQTALIINSATITGFTVYNYVDKFPAAIRQLATWLKEGKLNNSETIVNGFDHIPQAFLDLFEGKNEGKMVVKV